MANWTIFSTGATLVGTGITLFLWQTQSYQNVVKAIGLVCIAVGVAMVIWGLWGRRNPTSELKGSSATNTNTNTATGGSATGGNAKVELKQYFGVTATHTQPPQLSRADEPKEKPAPDGAQATLSVRAYPGAEAVLHVVNHEDYDVEVEAIAQIQTARPTHRRHEPYRLRWRGGKDRDAFIIPAGRDATAFVADTISLMSGSHRLRAIGRLGADWYVEAWDVTDGYAEILVRFATEPPLREPFERLYNVHYDYRQQRIEIGQPLE